jgi:GNAT superfamily N-acetyltransferase
MKEATFSIASTPEAIRRCHGVMKELRPHIHNAGRFIERVQRQQKRGYILAYAESEGEVRAVAGYRFLESLHSGKFMYVDDLVTRAADRSLGFGGRLVDWLVQQAREQGCENLELDSGVQRFDAHRFYMIKRMNISSYHFRLKIEHERAL